MSALITTRFIATGAHLGKTIDLGRDPVFHFVDGVCELEATMEDTAKLGHFMEVNWQVFPEGSKALKRILDEQRQLPPNNENPDGEGSVQGSTGPEGTQPAGGESVGQDGEGATGSDTGDEGNETDGDGPAPELNEKLARAILALDPEVEDHWTKDGQPSITAVCSLYGSSGVTRADVRGTIPGYTRAKAREQAAG